MSNDILLLLSSSASHKTQEIAGKISEGQRISNEDALFLYNNASLGELAIMADWVRQKLNSDVVYFNRNFHIEPTNICVYQCKFCAYSRKANEDGAWEYSIEDILNQVKLYDGAPVTEVHIVGGVHPNRDIYFYAQMLQAIRNHRSDIHIKAFTAVELNYMIQKSGMSIQDGLQYLKAHGLDSIPGGGAEIFDDEIRKQLCHEKSSTEMWLNIHENAHLCGLPSNATMLYGHIETYEHRVNHLSKLRELQDKTNGFNAFIPLKYRKSNNQLSHIGEVSIIEDLKNYAVSRIYMDNIRHLKAYWPMLGKEVMQLALSFGADDIDGTIDDTTKIYTMAGVKDKNKMDVPEMISIIRQSSKKPVERDSLYNIIKNY